MFYHVYRLYSSHLALTLFDFDSVAAMVFFTKLLLLESCFCPSIYSYNEHVILFEGRQFWQLHESKGQTESNISVSVKGSRKTRRLKTRHKENLHILFRISHDNDVLETQICCQCCWLTCPVWVLEASLSPLLVDGLSA